MTRSSDLLLQYVPQLFRNRADLRLVLSLDHHPHEVLGAGVANEDASAAGERLERFRERRLIAGQRLERRLRADSLIQQQLRHRIERVQLRERLADLAEDVAEHERGVSAVAGRVHEAVDDVALLLAAEDRAALQ